MDIGHVRRNGSLISHFLIVRAHTADPLIFPPCLTEEGEETEEDGRVNRERRQQCSSLNSHGLEQGA